MWVLLLTSLVRKFTAYHVLGPLYDYRILSLGWVRTIFEYAYMFPVVFIVSLWLWRHRIAYRAIRWRNF